MSLREFLKDIPQEEIDRKNQEQIRESEEMYKDFQNAYKMNCCSLCGNKLEYFNENEPCFHWFMLPKGI